MDDIFCTDRQFDSKKLLEDCKLINVKYNNLQQVNLTLPIDWQGGDREGLEYGAGSLYRDDIAFDKEARWGKVNPLFDGMYITNILGDIASEVQKYYPNTRVARARIMRMRPKTCLTYHRDGDNVVRAHIPIITSMGCMFIHDQTVSLMDKVGMLYLFNTSKYHTAINATKTIDRTHLVVNFVDQ